MCSCHLHNLKKFPLAILCYPLCLQLFTDQFIYCLCITNVQNKKPEHIAKLTPCLSAATTFNLQIVY